ncbi:hypothetical protein DFH06DRAFT_1140904 [Mycena polygramma]|nr:hypothetical protein DFH06DRAFT_1140904 [Mycena polygramma]
MATQTNRTYSDFFSSGLRAMSGMSYGRPASGYSSPVIPSTPARALKSSGRYNVLRTFARRPRTSSSPVYVSNFSPSENTTTTSTRKQRRSSIMNLSSRLLGRMLHAADTSSLADKVNDDLARRSDALYTPRSSSSYEKIRPSVDDPFGASPYSSSFFIDYIETPPVSITPPRTQRPQSFLLLGEHTKKLESLRFPLRRQRPTSIQSMPLPSHSRRSSFQYRPASRDKFDRSWALEEEEPTWSDWDVEEPRDPAADIDWRQFHNDLLHEDQ